MKTIKVKQHTRKGKVVKSHYRKVKNTDKSKSRASFISKYGDVKTGEAVHKTNKFRNKELKKYNY